MTSDQRAWEQAEETFSLARHLLDSSPLPLSVKTGVVLLCTKTILKLLNTLAPEKPRS